VNRTLLAHAAAATAALSAGASVVATRLAVGEVDPASLAFFRYLIGIAGFLAILPLIRPKQPVPASDIAAIALLGVLFFGLFPWAFNASLQYIPASRGAVGLATIPIQTLIVATLFGRERFTAAKLIGVVLAFAGIALVFGREAFAFSGSDALLGDGLMLLGGLCAAFFSIFSRPVMARHGPLFVTAAAMGFAVIALLPLSLAGDGFGALSKLSDNGWIALLFLGTFGGSVQFSLFNWALRWLPPTNTVLYLTLNPLTAMLLGVALIGESLSVWLVAGLAFVLLAILVASGIVPLRALSRLRTRGAPETR